MYTGILFDTLSSNHDDSTAMFKGVTLRLACNFPEHPDKVHAMPLLVRFWKCNLCFHLSELKVCFRQEPSGEAHDPGIEAFLVTQPGSDAIAVCHRGGD